MHSALIGHTGFVGGNLVRQHRFERCYNSRNIETIAGQDFDLLVCAGAPAAKWQANRFPDEDRACLGRLMTCLEQTRARRAILISTVDVFGAAAGVDEDSEPTGATPYGQHRLELEHFMSRLFPTLVVRLPGLFGPGLKKNAVYDLLHQNEVHKIDRRAVYQFYNLERLWSDICTAQRGGVSLVHFATEPVSMGDVARAAFGMELTGEPMAVPPRYDLRTRYDKLFGGAGGYLCSRQEVLEDLRAFVSVERGRRQCA
jgi:nucleoside-diphosphate-sugar epimerase